jgi:hypothetical protein
MMRSLQSALDIRIEPGRVAGRLRTWRGGTTMHCSADVAETCEALFQDLLSRLLRRRTLAKPRVRICLAVPEVRSSVLRFDTLPRRQDDRRLVVTQRFCRDHKLDPRATVIAYSVGSSVKGCSILADAMPKTMLHGLVSVLAGHGLHGDVIATEPSLALAGRGITGNPAPSVLVIEQNHGTTLLLLAPGGHPISVSTLSAAADGALTPRLHARLARYAAVLGVPQDAIEVCRSAPADGIGFNRTVTHLSPANPPPMLTPSEVAA